MVNRAIAKQFIYSHYNESASGALSYGDSGVLLPANLDQSVLLNSFDFESVPVSRNNTDRVDAPEGLADEIEYEKWNSSIVFDAISDVDLLAVVASLAIGPALTSTPGGAILAREHLIIPRSQAALDNPESITLAQIVSGDASRYPGCVCSQLSINGGAAEYVTCRATFSGNGRRETMLSFTAPNVRNAIRLRDSQGVLLLGTQASPESVSARVIDWSLTWSNELVSDSELSIDMIAAYDISDENLGWVLTENEIVSRNLSYVITLDYSGLAELDQLENLVARELDFTVEGDIIEGSTRNKLEISSKDIRFTKAQLVDRDGVQALQLTGSVLIDAAGTLADYLSMTITNTTTAYGQLQS